jgi:sugar (pentulose or hexulose) kinase
MSTGEAARFAVSERLIIVLDVGKTATKLSLWTPAGELLQRVVRANVRRSGPHYPVLDVEGIEAWLEQGLGALAQCGDVGAIVPVAHGAAAAIVRGGVLAAPVMDYEYDPPEDIRADYARERGDFSETGSPPMAMALNLGLQLHCIEQTHPDAFRGEAMFLPWAQFWAWKLSGVAASEVTSLGVHTDLWAPWRREASGLAKRRGWAERLAPMRHAREKLGTISAEWAHRTGLPADTSVHVGLHDSNAALVAARVYPEFACGEAVLVSTGTWFVAMRTPAGNSARAGQLTSGHGCLVNVDVEGRPAPTALFMGGRELELLGGEPIDAASHQAALLDAAKACVHSGSMVLPTMAAGTGPYPTARGEWRAEPGDPIARGAAAALYAALMTETGLGLIGASGAVLIEGRFGRAELYARALASLRPDMNVYVGGAESDVAFGALRVLAPGARALDALIRVAPLEWDLGSYARAWRAAIASR